MQKLLSRSLWLCALAGVVSAQVPQQTDHIYNPSFVVKAYKLSAAKEAEYFSVTDGHMSAFWRVWAAQGLPTLDKVELQHDVHHYDGEAPTGPDDVGLNIRFAYSDEGIYLLYEVYDDNWVGYVSAADYENDAVELFNEGHSAEELYGSPDVYFPCLSDFTFAHQLTETYSQIQVRFGGPELVEEFSFNYWRPDMLGVSDLNCSPGTGGDGLVQYNRTITFPEAEATYGIMIEILPQEGNWRRQEWRIPWSIWGGPNANLTARTNGEKLAICVGYNDLDIGQLGRTGLRWRMADPYTNDPVAGTSVDAWSDLLFDESFDDILAAAGMTWSDSECACYYADARMRGRVAAAPEVIRTEYFTVDGQLIDPADARLRYLARSVVLKRTTFADNSSKTLTVPLSVGR